jgi:hypothetical protein
MINRHTTLSHHFLDLPVADRIRHIPAHAPQNDISLKMAPFERDRHHPIPQKQSTDHIPDTNQLKLCEPFQKPLRWALAFPKQLLKFPALLLALLHHISFYRIRLPSHRRLA